MRIKTPKMSEVYWICTSEKCSHDSLESIVWEFWLKSDAKLRNSGCIIKLIAFFRIKIEATAVY
jgi:hypothetical protein